MEYLVEVVDNNGNVGASTNKNFFASPTVAPPAPAGITATSGGPGTPDGSSGWTSDATISLAGPAGTTFTFRLYFFCRNLRNGQSGRAMMVLPCRSSKRRTGLSA